MADQNAGQVPDLASVLANLAALAPASSQQSTQNSSGTQHGVSQSLPAATPQDAALNLAKTLEAIRQQPPVSVTPTQDPRPIPPYRRSTPAISQKPSTPLIDPATITDWPQGLRCVTKIAAQNPNFSTILQRMMADQTKHEQQWFTARKTLEVQRATPAELEDYDRKVYRASQQMVEAMTAQLKGLGVPFFGVVPEKLVSAEEKASGEQKTASHPGVANGPGITEAELLKLQQKMLQHLDDLYRG